MRIKNSRRGSSILIVSVVLILLSVAGIAFLKRAQFHMMSSGMILDSANAAYQMEGVHVQQKSKLLRAMNGIMLSGRLQYVGGPATETFANISNTYVSNPLELLKDLIRTEAMNGAGVVSNSSEFASFETAFPSTWTDPDVNDGNYYEVRYTFSPLSMVQNSSPQQLLFEYEYRLEVRAFGDNNFSTSQSEDAGVILVTISGAPFSQWAVFMDSMKNQNGSTLVFAGGNTSAQFQEVYAGPVHVNQLPYFYGHPVFTDVFTSATAKNTWVNYNVTDYSCCAVFQSTSTGGVSSVSMPTQIFNTYRLAAGDTSTTAATNNSAVTNSELRGFLANHATGTVTGGTTAVPNDIYIPIDNSTSKQPTGGVFVQGDAKIQLNVVQGSSEFGSGQFAQIQTAHQSCKFQKIAITHMTGGVTPRDIYIGDDPCNVTYVFNSASSGSPPVMLNGRINGNVHVDGKIDELGGASRTRPAIVQDFQFTVSAKKDVRIINDIQYEDTQYVTSDANGNMGSTVVANPYGSVGSSGILPTAQDIAPKVSSDSQTVLGIISTSRNIYLHANAPSNINLQAALFAGNSAAYDSSTGLGCGTNTASTRGCGFGAENYDTKINAGAIKFFGSLSEYKDQTTGVLASPPKGYASRYFYDARLRQAITPPAFPVSDTPAASATIKPYRTWRIARQSN